MTKQTITTLALTIALSLSMAVGARASQLTVSPTFDISNQAALPDTTDYEGIFYDDSTSFPPPSITIGAFNFIIPTGQHVLGATISGTFGDVNIPNSALTDLFVLGGTIQVGACDLNPDTSYPPCAAGTIDGSLVPWSHTFTSAELNSLAADFSAGSIDFTAVQNSPGAVVVGAPTLDLQVTPEPAPIVTIAGGLLALAALRRRK